MTQEEKQLLLKDLCARLPYGVILNVDNGKYREDKKIWPGLFNSDSLWDAKPYLRPMSSMTEEEKKELYGRYNVCLDKFSNTLTLREHSEGYWDEDTECSFVDYLWLIDWLNAHHFDYRGLIEKGLAIEAPDGMYKVNNG